MSQRPVWGYCTGGVSPPRQQGRRAALFMGRQRAGDLKQHECQLPFLSRTLLTFPPLSLPPLTSPLSFSCPLQPHPSITLPSHPSPTLVSGAGWLPELRSMLSGGLCSPVLLTTPDRRLLYSGPCEVNSQVISGHLSFGLMSSEPEEGKLYKNLNSDLW